MLFSFLDDCDTKDKLLKCSPHLPTTFHASGATLSPGLAVHSMRSVSESASQLVTPNGAAYEASTRPPEELVGGRRAFACSE